MEALLRNLHLPAEPRSVPVARRQVREVLTGQRVDVDAVALVVTEAITNAIVHAYRDRPEPGQVRVCVAADDQAVELVVADDGDGLMPRVGSPGAGLGIPLITALADHVELESGPGTRLRARFSRKSPGGEGLPPTPRAA